MAATGVRISELVQIQIEDIRVVSSTFIQKATRSGVFISPTVYGRPV